MLVFAALLAACVQESSVVAPDSSPFRQGQWAAQFGAGSSTASFGFLRFRSPRTAWVIDLRVTGGHSEALVSDSTGTRFAGLNSRANVDIRFGTRHLRVGKRVIPFYSFGVLGGLSHSTSGTPGIGGSDRNGWSAGLFGDVGASYMVTSNLALAANGTIIARYTTETAEQSGPSGVQKVRTWDLSGSALSATLLVQLYF